MELKVCQNVCPDKLALYTYEPMADEDLLKQDDKEQGKLKVVANDGKWTPRTEIK